MRGHKLSTTRQLNKHWQSGIIGEVIPDLGDLHLNIGKTHITIHKNNGFDISIGHSHNFIALPLDFEFNAYGFKFKVRDIIPLLENYEYQITKSFYFDYGYEILLIKHGKSEFRTLDIHINDKTLSNEWYIKIPYNYFKIDKTNITYFYKPGITEQFKEFYSSGVGFYDVHSDILKLNIEKNKIFHWAEKDYLLGVNGEIQILKDYYYTFMNDFYNIFPLTVYKSSDIFYNGHYDYFYFNKQIGDEFRKTINYLGPNYNVDLSIYNPEEPIHEQDSITNICRNTTGNKRPYYDFINYPIHDVYCETYYQCPGMFNAFQQKDYKITASEGIYKLESINPHAQ